jgi:hypothetical protein
LSPSKIYTVSRLGPAARIVPSLLDFDVTTAAAAAPVAAVVPAGAYELWLVALAGLAVAVVEVPLLLLPQPASSPATRMAARGRDLRGRDLDLAIDIHLQARTALGSPGEIRGVLLG